jgi:prepilin-type N-terminal cleavage/methylation domain-containing protein
MNKYIEERKEQGFTLIELLIAIVVVGILAAVAIVGIAGLTNTGGKSACTATMDAARASSAAYYANHGAWPTTFTAMTTDTPQPELELESGVTVATTTNTGDTLTNGTWKLVGALSASASPSFTGAGLGCQ